MAQRQLWFGFLILTIVASADTNADATAAIDKANEIADNAQMIATTGSYDAALKSNGMKEGSKQGETQPSVGAQVPVPPDRPTLQELKQQYESEATKIKQLGDTKTESSHDLRSQARLATCNAVQSAFPACIQASNEEAKALQVQSQSTIKELSEKVKTVNEKIQEAQQKQEACAAAKEATNDTVHSTISELKQKVKALSSAKKDSGSSDMLAELDKIGNNRSSGTSNDTFDCESDELGWAAQNSNDGKMAPWQPGAWSCSKPVSFQGFKPRTEQYQVNRPGCPAMCGRRSGGDEPARAGCESKLDAPESANTKVAEPAVSCGNAYACAISEGGAVLCDGRDGYKQVSGVNQYKGVRFRSVSAGKDHTCGVVEGSLEIKCWGKDNDKQVSGVKQYKGVRFRSVSAGQEHTCGVVEGSLEIKCWGRDKKKQVSGVNQYKGVRFRSVSAGRYHTCGVVEGSLEIKCWGRDKYKQVSGVKQYKGVRFRSVSAGRYTTCGVVEGSLEIKCWGSYRRFPWTKMRLEPSCATEHPEKEGRAACTSCSNQCSSSESTASNCTHFTIVDPRTNTGTCTKVECPFCKPKSCCGARHKHYVVNTESLEGVCVRHNDDCTPMCVPTGDEHPEKRRVCSKGCNQLVKVSKSTSGASDVFSGGGASNHEAAKFDLVVCQADKRVLCEGRKNVVGGEMMPGGSMGNTTAADVNEGSSKCAQEKQVRPMVVCNFSVPLWNLGGTCIANHVYKEKSPQCATLAKQSLDVRQDIVQGILKDCRMATEYDDERCNKNPNDATCKKTARERDYCSRLAMSF